MDRERSYTDFNEVDIENPISVLTDNLHILRTEAGICQCKLSNIIEPWDKHTQLSKYRRKKC